ncbi:MAG TPA: C1 family peptidase [Devosia sp.]|nr:C1 family peptidase [Devosia sp.]
MARDLMTKIGAGLLALVLFVTLAGDASAQQRRATGANFSPPDVIASAPETPVYRDFLPAAVDLSRYFPPVGDQLMQGSCVGWATAYAARAYYAYQIEHRDTQQMSNIPSPAWVFNIIHLGNNCDNGSQIYDALKVLQRGALSLADYPYDDTKCPMPLPPARSRATDFKIEDFALVFSRTNDAPDAPLTDQAIDDTKGQLATGHPVVIAALLDNSFFYLSREPGHQIWTANGDDDNQGGHAFTLVGYDDAAGVFKFINSWNTSWGIDGYGYMTYDTFKARVVEGWTMMMAGDPEIALADADFHGADLDPVPPPAPPVIYTPIIVKPTDAMRDIDAEPIDFGDLNCGSIQMGTAADGTSTATGFVGTQAELDRVNGLFDGKVEDNQVVLAPWPKCELMLTLQAQLNDSDTPEVVIDPEAPQVGDNVNVGIRTPGFASYIYAAYFAADGSVLNLTQPGSNSLKPKGTHQSFTLASSEGQGLTVTPPAGDEMLLVVASESPLFDQERPGLEADRQFLSGLRQAVLAGDAGRITATLLPVTTTE